MEERARREERLEAQLTAALRGREEADEEEVSELRGRVEELEVELEAVEEEAHTATTRARELDEELERVKEKALELAGAVRASAGLLAEAEQRLREVHVQEEQVRQSAEQHQVALMT
eukprot:70153-Rhodomonas_salina.1